MQKEKSKTLEIIRTYNHPRTLVWNAFTEAHHLAKWWGPRETGISIKTFECKPGGVFHFSMKYPDGSIAWGKFTYEEIKAPMKITFISAFADENANVVKPPFPGNFPMYTHNTWFFTEEAGKTTIRLLSTPYHANAVEEAFFVNLFDDMKSGYGGTLDQLEEYLAL